MPPTKTSQKGNILLPLLFLIALLAVGTATYFFFFKNQAGLDLGNISKTSKAVNAKQWINCDNVRDVIEEGDTLYVGCLGGVLVVNKNTGEVKDELSMTDGLSDVSANSLIKSGDILYVGSQDGFTKFNLKNNKAEKISVKEGLPNGSNIKLAADGNFIWVATFDGLARYDKNSGEIKSYKQELLNSATQWGVSSLWVTNNSVYANMPAHAESTGGIARYDKASGTWEQYSLEAFGKAGEYNRLDIFGTGTAGNRVIVAENSALWQAEDKNNTTWEHVPNPVGENTYDDYGLIRTIVDQGNTARILTSKGFLFDYNPDNKTAELVYPVKTHSPNLLSGAGNFGITNDKKIWFHPVSYPRDENDPWLRWFDTSDFSSQSFTLKGRPQSFSGIISVIDNTAILSTFDGLWRYDLKEEKLERIALPLSITSNEMSNLAFQPIPGSTQVLVINQGCGISCDKPEIFILDYPANAVKAVALLPEMKTADGQYTPVLFKSFEEGKPKIQFGYENQMGIINLEDLSWSIKEEEHTLDAYQPSLVMCNKNYKFAENSNTFTTFSCNDKVENEAYEWTYDKDDQDYEIEALVQKSKHSGDILRSPVPLGPEKYSPFGTAAEGSALAKGRFKGIMYAEKKIFILTERGLSIYDPEKDSWRVITTEDGLVSNDIDSIAIKDNVLYAVSHWGGFSVIPLK